MAFDRRIQIRQLRAKARSTTFPAEALALNTKADELEAKYGPAAPEQRPRATFRPGPTMDEYRRRAEAAQRVAERRAQAARDFAAQMRRMAVHTNAAAAAAQQAGVSADAMGAFSAIFVRINTTTGTRTTTGTMNDGTTVRIVYGPSA